MAVVPDTSSGEYIVEKDIQYETTQYSQYSYSDTPHSNRNSTILNIILSSALLLALIACIYLCINKIKSKPKRKQTDESNTSKKMDEYSEVHIDVNRLNSLVQSPTKPYKKNSEGYAFTVESFAKKSTSALESMYGEENNIIEQTNGEYENENKTKKLSTTASEGNMDKYYENTKQDNDDQLLYGNDAQFVAQAAPIISFDREK